MCTSSDGHHESFDAVAIIQAFVDDTTQCQLELPNLSVAQRKQIKNIAERYPELSCESFGFGAERQIHVSKKASEPIPQGSPYGLGSTLDAFVGQVGIEGPNVPPVPEPIKIQTSIADSDFYLASMKERLRDTLEHDRAVSPDRSTTASTSSPIAIRNLFSDSYQPRLSLPVKLSVRNTFIDVEDAHADNREVQSMPHGMFGHYLNAELNERMNVEINKSSPVAQISGDSALAPGTQIIIVGLQKLPAFNGSEGTVGSFDRESQRYNILLSTPANGHRWAKVKQDNIQVLSPKLAAPCRASLTQLDDHVDIVELFERRPSPVWSCELGEEQAPSIKVGSKSRPNARARRRKQQREMQKSWAQHSSTTPSQIEP